MCDIGKATLALGRLQALSIAFTITITSCRHIDHHLMLIHTTWSDDGDGVCVDVR
jgi:hypothetical protein